MICALKKRAISIRSRITKHVHKMNHDVEILDPLPIQLSHAKLKKWFRLTNSRQWDEVLKLIAETQDLIHAKAIYKVSYVDGKHTDAVSIEGIEFNSRILRKNLDAVERVFPFAITIGDLVSQKADTTGDLKQKYYLDVIGNIAIGSARQLLEEHLQRTFALAGMSFMSPGSLVDWPLEEQKPLFSLFGDGELPIGVSLNSHMLMIPVKSISGIYFPTEIPFYSCQLCPRKACPGRKAAYSEKNSEAYGV
jgi:hypothetical protein